VLAAVDRGMARAEVAKTFGLSLPTIKRYLKLRRETKDVERKRITGPPSRKGAALREWLPAQLESNPDLTLQEHCEAFEEGLGISVSTATIGRLPGGWPVKKRR